MNQKKVISFLSISGIVLLILMGWYLTQSHSNEQRHYKIAMITKHNYGDYYHLMESGARKAVGEYDNIDLHFLTSSAVNQVVDQASYIDRAIEEKYDAIMISPNNKTETFEKLKLASEEGIEVLLVDSMDVDNKWDYIGTNNKDFGTALAQNTIDMVKEPTDYLVVSASDIGENTKRRYQAFNEELLKHSDWHLVDFLTVDLVADESVKKVADFIKAHEQIGVIVALNEIATEAVGSAVASLGMENELKVIGVDANRQILNYLELGAINGLMIQNSYSMGYLSVDYLYHHLTGRTDAQNSDTSYRMITKATMFDPENEFWLFPIDVR